MDITDRVKLVTAGRSAGISVCAYPAGHLVGASAWSVCGGREEVAYMVNYNQQAERCVVGAPHGCGQRCTNGFWRYTNA